MTEQQDAYDRAVYDGIAAGACRGIGASRDWLEQGGLQRLVAHMRRLDAMTGYPETAEILRGLPE